MKWRYAKAVLLLPVNVLIVIPGLILWLSGRLPNLQGQRAALDSASEPVCLDRLGRWSCLSDLDFTSKRTQGLGLSELPRVVFPSI